MELNEHGEYFIATEMLSKDILYRLHYERESRGHAHFYLIRAYISGLRHR